MRGRCASGRGTMGSMRPFRLLAVFVLTLSTVAFAAIGTGGPAAAHKVPRWVKHVEHWNGGLSNGVRERAAQVAGQIQVSSTTGARPKLLGAPTLDNVQMNGDSDPPLPQDEPSIAESLVDPM